MNEISFDLFVAVWNEGQGLPTPALHAEIARWLERRWRRGDRQFLLMAFRNSGKSTLVGLFSAWMLAGDPDLRILVLAADLALARKMVRNVKRVIERHPLTSGLKPQRADQWASDRFTINRSAELRDPSMQAKGIGANITGSRADIVICDDVEVPNTCDTVTKRADLRERLQEIDYVLVPGGLQLYVGTPHSFYTIYAAEKRPESGEEQAFLDGFTRLELPILDALGESRWPERFPIERIEAIRRRSGPSKFTSQMMLQPVNFADGRLEPDRMRTYDDDLDYHQGNGEATLRLGARKLVSASCFWDPSYGAPGAGDASVIAAVFTDAEGAYFLQRIAYLTHDPSKNHEVDEATQMCRQVVDFVRDLHLPAVIVETNGLGRFLPGLLRRQFEAAGLRRAVIERASSRSKDLRILDAFEAILAAGRLHIHDSVRATPFIAEMREWTPGGGGRDDGLDAVSGCLLNEPVRLPRRSFPATGERSAPTSWRGQPTAFRADLDFDP